MEAIEDLASVHPGGSLCKAFGERLRKGATGIGYLVPRAAAGGRIGQAHGGRGRELGLVLCLHAHAAIAPTPAAPMRYSSAMATIQVREVPEELYEVLRRRARRAGQSLQAYMRDQVVALAQRPTKDEAIGQIESVLGRLGHDGP